ncbi:uncharacterized protein [Amphiura filiformis]|uniref:uncharacterized protein n=1 Tax=Amphiura filiformis TaxID=82378 RepID=UPI003B223627
MPLTPKDPCGHCGNNDAVNFRQYRTKDNVFIGKCCKKCGIEWLKADYLSPASRNCCDIQDSVSEVLYENTPIKPEVNKAFQVQSARTKIDTKYAAEILKPTDHITWHRVKGIWHHSIVSEVNQDKNEIIVIHWNKKGSDLQIYEETLTMNPTGDSLFNQMYRIDYPEEIKAANAPELVLARARSRVGDTGYGLLTDNCEAFATYCKTGIAKSHQVIWLVEKIKESCGLGNIRTIAKHGVRFISKVTNNIPQAAGEIIPAEVIEEALNGSQAVGAGILLVIETGFVIWDLSQAYAERKDSKISKNDFVEASVRRIFEGIVSAGFAIGCSIGLEIGIGALFGLLFGPVGAVVGGIVGGLIGGIAGGAVGRAIGTWGGSVTGKMMKISELKPGDHIVLKGWFFHPRCHAIVVDYKADDETEGKLLVIRNTHERGVVEEWLTFEQPLFRVEYKKGACLDPEQVIENARSKLGHTRYNLATYNCKTFARECKTIAQI